jgi:hypothetical protein
MDVRINCDLVIAHLGLQASAIYGGDNDLGGLLQRHVAGDALTVDPLTKFGKHAAAFDANAQTKEPSCHQEGRVRGQNRVSAQRESGSNPILRAQTLHVSFLKPWNLLAEINSATTTLSPVSGENEKWWR